MNLMNILELIFSSPLLIFLTSISAIMILLMIITIIRQRSIGTTINQIGELNEPETDSPIQKNITTNNEDFSVQEKHLSMNEVGNFENKTDFKKETQDHLLIKNTDSCHHCEEFKDLSFSVCPNCGKPLNISE